MVKNDQLKEKLHSLQKKQFRKSIFQKNQVLDIESQKEVQQLEENMIIKL